MTGVVRFGVALAALVAVGHGRAAAQEFPDNPLIVQGISLYEDLEYESSIEALQRALVRAENVPAQKIQIFKYLALNYLVLQRTDDATQAFRQLLAIRPEFALDATFAPEHREFLEGVRAQWEAEGRPGWVSPESLLRPVAIAHELPAEAERQAPMEVRASIEDPDQRLSNLVLAYRAAGESDFVRVSAAPSGPGFMAAIPGDRIEPPVIEYYFEALDASGRIVGHLGDASTPLRVPVPGVGEGGIWTKWWFWTAIGVGVAAAVVIPVAIVVGGEDGGSGNPATVTIVLCDPLVPGDCP